MNKGILSEKLDNKVLISLINSNNSKSSSNNSIEEKEKKKQCFNKKNNNNIEEIKNKESSNILLSSNESIKKSDNSNDKNTAFDIGSISKISKNDSSSLKERNIEEENKDKGFDNIIRYLIE